MLKKAFSMILALVLCLGIFVGCDSNTPAETTKPTQTTQPAASDAPSTAPQETEPEKLYFEEPLKITMARPAQVDCSWYYDLVKELLNVEIQVMDMDNFSEQYSLMVSENNLPDLTWMNGNAFGNEYGPQGAYINVMDYLDQMPNFKAMLEANPKYLESSLFVTDSGAMYHMPCIQVNGTTILRGWYYREDIFEKHGLEWPTTREELEAVLRKLKELYPESYPICMRYLGGAHITNVVDMGVAFDTKLIFPGRNSAYANLDNDTGKWYEGATSENMKEMISWLKQMMDEDLIHPSGPTMSNDEWKAYLNTSNGFISWDRVDQLASINVEGVKQNPDFKLVVADPIPMVDSAEAAYVAPDLTNYSFLISANCERLDDVLAYLDWMYSKEGILATNYGKEGETYTLDADGNPVWMDAVKAEDAPQTGRGLLVGGDIKLTIDILAVIIARAHHCQNLPGLRV